MFEIQFKYIENNINIIFLAILDNATGHNLRLLTTVLLSHQVWSEACNVEISIALAVPEADISKRKTIADSMPSLIDLCKPVKVSVAPKPIKRTL